MKRLFGTAVLAVGLAACGSSGSPAADPSNAASTGTPTGPAKDARYATVAQLRDAAVAAGLDCPSYAEKTDVTTDIAGAADCSDEIVLMTFVDQATAAAHAEQMRGLSSGTGIGYSLLVGPNWIVNAPKRWIDLIQPALGGVVEFAPDAT